MEHEESVRETGRREFVLASLGALAALTGLTGCTTSSQSSESSVASPASKGESTTDGSSEQVQYGFLVTPSRCKGCGACIVACRQFNHLTPDTQDRRTITTVTDKINRKVHVSTACMHCEDPSCARGCPAGAITKGAGGIVTVNHERCIGCRYCYQACPYGVPTYNDQGMDKCDFCLGSGLPLGDEPACVAACEFRALSYGTLPEFYERTDHAATPIADENNPSCLIV